MSMNAPQAVGIIIDGNRRWAKQNMLPSLEGHRRGLQKVKDAIEWASEAGIKEVTFYTFSTENWNRSAEEVAYLLLLFKNTFENEFAELSKKDFRFRFIGQKEKFSSQLRVLMEKLETESADKSGMLVQIAISYGGRAEIMDAVNRVAKEGRETITEEDFRNAMWSSGMKDPDLIIRTGGDKRLSNFLLFQAAYSELFFTDTMWPAFTKEEFHSILTEFAGRERRHGK